MMMTFGSKDSSDSLSAWHWYSVLAVRFLVVLFALLELFPTIWRLPDKLPVNEEDNVGASELSFINLFGNPETLLSWGFPGTAGAACFLWESN